MSTGAKIAAELGIPIDETTYPERAERVVRAGAGGSDEPKFTQGELTVIGPSSGKNIGFDDGGDHAIVFDGKVIGEAFRKVGPNTVMPAEANAYLFAAGHRMYAFIAEFIRWVDDTNGNDRSQLLSLYEDAKSELTKARGE